MSDKSESEDLISYYVASLYLKCLELDVTELKLEDCEQQSGL